MRSHRSAFIVAIVSNRSAGGKPALECLQKRDQRAAIVGRQIEAKPVTLHCSRRDTVSLEAGRHVVVAQAPRIEPVFERRHRTVVLERAAIPHAFQRRHFVIAGAAARAERQVRDRFRPTSA